MTNLKNKSELLFLYDIKDANPNGDPLDENKPRIDEETGQNIVTDVRLKRTIRDYLFDYKGFNGTDGKDIFVREILNEQGKVQDGKSRAKNFDGEKAEILKNCIDIRLFGGTIPLPNDSITLTGPVQFKMGRSLHPVMMKHIQGTGAFSSKEQGSKQATFREEDILYYSLLAFHGIINPTAARDSQAREEDIQLLLEGMWEGTKNLISRSKFGQMPRLLLKINYNTPHFFIGDLDHLVKVSTLFPFEKIRNINDLKLDVSELQFVLNHFAKQITSIGFMIDPRLQLCCNDNVLTLEGLTHDIKTEPIEFV